MNSKNHVIMIIEVTMKNIIYVVSILIAVLLLAGCEKEQETVAYACKQDAISGTYSATFDYVVNSKDGISISSIESAAIYTATYEDTDFSAVIATLKEEQQKYELDYMEAVTELEEKKEQVFFKVLIPINNHNLELFRENDSSLIENELLNTQLYRDFLESHGYTCK